MTFSAYYLRKIFALSSSPELVLSLTGQLVNYKVTLRQQNCPEALKSFACPKSAKAEVDSCRLSSGNYPGVINNSLYRKVSWLGGLYSKEEALGDILG